MAIFIPERVGVQGARSIHIKRALAKLDDAYVVRRPLRPQGSTPDFFIQHPAYGWLAVAVSEASPATLAGSQLLDAGERAALDALLAQLRVLPVPARLLILWHCSKEEVARATRLRQAEDGVRMLSRAEFTQSLHSLAPQLMSPISEETETALMRAYFAEAEIPALCTTRRHFKRDNSATLQSYFLDAQQEHAAKLDLALPQEQLVVARDLKVRLVNGVAGSGKTLIALSRALLLAEMHPRQRVLMLIHNRPVVADLNARLYRMHGAPPDNLSINTFSAWLHRQWRNVYRRPPQMPAMRMIDDLILQLRGADSVLRLPVQRLREEFDFINESMLTSEAHYLRASRSGRGFALRAQERSAMWSLFVAVTATLHTHGLSLWSALPLDICRAPGRQRLEKYHHILIDEAQFFAPSWFHMTRLAMHPGSSLFLCADPNQGFMKSRLSWKSVGLDVAGKTQKLRKSYRTTRANLASANQILQQYAQGDPEDYLQPDLNGMEPGAGPVLVYADSAQDAVERLVNELSACLHGGHAAPFKLGDLLVIYGAQASSTLLYNRLCLRFGADKVWWQNKRDQRKAPPSGWQQDHLRMANLDTAAGLEAGVVFLVGIDHLLTPENAGPDLENNARKLYMAMTRAGSRLIVIASTPVHNNIRAAFAE